MLLIAHYVLPVSQPFIECGAVLVQDDRIADVGPAVELKAKYPDEPVSDFGQAALMPGFVDAHTHLEYSAMRGLIEDAPYATWKQEINEKSRLMSAQDWEDSARLGALETVASGITTIADVTATGASHVAASEIGLRGVIYREVTAMEHSYIDYAMDSAIGDIEKWKAASDSQPGGLLKIGIAPASVFQCNPGVFKRVAQYATDTGLPVAVHLAGSREEEQFVRYGSSPFSVHNVEMGAGYGIDAPPWMPTGESPVSYLLNWDILEAPNVLAIHCVHVSDRDVEHLAKRDVAVAICPRCNAKLAMGKAPLDKFVRAGLRVGLATDSPAAAASMDPIAEMRIGLFTQRSGGNSRFFPTAQQMLRTATLGSAEALRLDDEIGSLDSGKKADVIAIDLSNSHHVPTHDPAAAIVYTANQDNVLMTMVDGKILYDGAHCSGIDPARTRERAEEMRVMLRG